MTRQEEGRLDLILVAVREEVMRVDKLQPAYHSAHEACAVIREEFEELWDEVKGKQNKGAMMCEGVHLASTAVRFLMGVKMRVVRNG